MVQSVQSDLGGPRARLVSPKLRDGGFSGTKRGGVNVAEYVHVQITTIRLFKFF